MSPEYVVDGLFSVKSDVFSFGVLVLEIISGKRNRGFCHSDHGLNLLGHVSKHNKFPLFLAPYPDNVPLEAIRAHRHKYSFVN